MKVAVYAICKNEAAHVARWYESASEADAIYVLDTGSTDNTCALLEALPKVQLHTANFVPFRFDIARNMISNQVPDDFDVAVFLDFDEVLESGWRTKLEAVPAPYDSLWFRMIFSRGADGEPDVVYNRLMAHRPHSYIWMYPIHEVLVPQNPAAALESVTDITVEHLPDKDKPRSDYLDLLISAVEEMPHDPRMRQYLGRECMYREEWLRATIHFTQHVTMSDHPDCISESYRYIARCQERVGDTQAAEHALLRALSYAPNQREPYAELSSFFQRQQDIERCLAFALSCASIPENSDYIIRERRYYREWPYHMIAWCYNQLGISTLAERYITMALNMSPDHPQVISDYISLTGKVPQSLLTKINSGQLSVTDYESTSSRHQQEDVPSSDSTEAEEVSQEVSNVESSLSS